MDGYDDSFFGIIYETEDDCNSPSFIGKYVDPEGIEWEFKTNYRYKAYNTLKESAKQYFKLKKDEERRNKNENNK